MTPASRTHITELDGLRGLAVVMVLGWHFLGAMMDRTGAFSEFIYAATIFGRTGVDLFFVLSGFLIIGILADEKDNPGLFRTFYARRLLRIHPPYVMLIIMYWVCYAATGPNDAFNTSPSLAAQIIAQLTFTWNWLMAFYGSGIASGFSVTWSVAIEEWFYLIIPAVIAMTPRARLPALLVCIGLGSAAGRGVFYLALPDFYMAPYVLPPFRLDGLAAGGLLALMYRHESIWDRLKSRRATIWKTTVLLALSVPFLIGLLRNDLAINMYTWGHLYLSVTGCFIIATVLLFPGDNRLALLRTAVLRGAGKISYTLYLIHPLFLSLVFVIAERRELVTSFGDAILAASALAAAIAASVISFKVLEEPLQAAGRRKFRYNAATMSVGTSSQEAGNGNENETQKMPSGSPNNPSFS